MSKKYYILASLCLLVIIGAGLFIGIKSRRNSFIEAQVKSSNSQQNQEGINQFIDPVSGELNYQQIDEMLNQIPPAFSSQALDRIESRIEQAIQENQLTKIQADKLLEYIREKLV